jgi:hypothetical protein
MSGDMDYLVDRWFIMLTPEPVADGDVKGGLPNEWGEVLYSLPYGYFMVQLRGYHCRGTEPSEQRLIHISEMQTWVWFEDEEDAKYEFESTYEPRLEMWAREPEWEWQRTHYKDGTPRDGKPGPGELVVRSLKDVGKNGSKDSGVNHVVEEVSAPTVEVWRTPT